MRLPELTEIATAKDNTEEFKGYNHNLRNGVGEWYNQKNMTTDYYPAASPRDKRARQIFASTPSISTGVNTYKAGKTLAMAYTDERLITLQKFAKGSEDAGCVFVDNGDIGTQQLIEHTYNYSISSIKSKVRDRYSRPVCWIIDITATLDSSPSGLTIGNDINVKFKNLLFGNLEARINIVSLIENTITATMELHNTDIRVAKNVSAQIAGSTSIQYSTRISSHSVLINKAAYFDCTTKKYPVRMGSYICLFPDGVVYESANTEDPVPIYKIEEGEEISNVKVETVVNNNKSPYDYSPIELGTNYRFEDNQIQYYIEDKCLWTAQQTFLIIYKPNTTGTFGLLKEGDVVTLKYSTLKSFDPNNISKIKAGVLKNGTESLKILKKGVLSRGTMSGVTEDTDYIVVNGFIYTYEDYLGSGNNAANYIKAEFKKIMITREFPDVSFACESQNRIWCCSKDGHEIYASALGNPYNFYDYSGISTDSYAVNVGTDGEFTGCVNYMGQPLFFKENALHYVSGSYPSNNGTMDGMSYAVTTITNFKGVEKGSEKSFAIINNILYYKSSAGIVAYDGANTAVISDALGKEKFKNAVAGAYKNKYYVSMQDRNGIYHLFVYDTELGTWCKEDNTQVLQFLSVHNELLYIDENGENVYSVADENMFNNYAYNREDDFDWECETGNFGYSYPNNKYLSRFQVRMQITEGAKASIFIQYNSDGVWHRKGEMTGKGIRTHLIPIVPVRCDHMKIKIAGKGDVKIFSIAKILEEGGDV